MKFFLALALCALAACGRQSGVRESYRSDGHGGIRPDLGYEWDPTASLAFEESFDPPPRFGHTYWIYLTSQKSDSRSAGESLFILKRIFRRKDGATVTLVARVDRDRSWLLFEITEDGKAFTLMPDSVDLLSNELRLKATRSELMIDLSRLVVEPSDPSAGVTPSATAIRSGWIGLKVVAANSQSERDLRH